MSSSSDSFTMFTRVSISLLLIHSSGTLHYELAKGDI